MTYKTEKRTELIKLLESTSGAPFTVDEISERLLADGKGKSTVYRLISSLVSEGKVRKISDAKTRHVSYQYIASGHCSEHLHLKCKDCGNMLHLDEQTSHIFEESVMKKHGFSLDEGALLFGVCHSCMNRNKEEREKV